MMKQSSPQAANAPASTALKVLMVPGRKWTEYDRLAVLAYARGNLSEAVAMWDAALQVAESEASGSNASKAVAHILEQLVCAHYELGDLERAEDVCKRALIIISSHYGSRHTKAGNCLNNLAGIYFRGKRYSDAEAICHTVLSIYEMSYGRQHPEVGLALHNLAMIYHAQKKYMHAEKHYRRAFALTAAGLKPTDPTAVKVATNYATLLESTGRKSEAERIRGKLQSAKHN